MATITKDSEGRSPYWICCFRAADGRRLKKSTKQKERAKGLEVCLTLQRTEDMAGKGTLTEARARALIGEVLERTTGETLPFFTAEGFIQDWLRGKEISKAGNTFKNYRQTMKAFLAHLGRRARLNIAAITPKDIADFRDAEIGSGKNPNSVRYAVKHLRVPFNAARRQGIIATNPAEAVELPGETKGEDGGKTSRQPFSPEQVAALLAIATARNEKGKPVLKDGEDWHGAILLSYYTGARLSDTANVTWNAIDLAARMLTFRPQKTGKEVKIPLHPELETYLLKLPTPESAKAFVFPMLAGISVGTLGQRFSRLMKRAGTAGEVVTAARGSKGRTVNSLSFHSLRHSFNSQMANAGVSQEIRKKLTGHTSNAMNAHYTHHETEPLRAAINMLPSITATR